MDSPSLHFVKEYVGLLKVQCMTLQYTDEVVQTIATQLPASNMKTTLELVLPGIKSAVDGAAEYIQLLERIIAAVPPLLLQD